MGPKSLRTALVHDNVRLYYEQITDVFTLAQYFYCTKSPKTGLDRHHGRESALIAQARVKEIAEPVSQNVEGKHGDHDNDIYTLEDAQFLMRQGTLDQSRIRGVETGGCPHAAIREDASMNLEAVEDLEQQHPGLELILIESGGDNLSAAFSPELVDEWIYVIDVAGGDKVPRKGGPGVCRSSLLIINKIDLAEMVGASLAVMDRDAKKMRASRPFLFTDLKSSAGLDAVVTWVNGQMMSPERRTLCTVTEPGTHTQGGHSHGHAH